jgi:hypothetical protein
MYLSFASLLHLCLIGFGGTLAVELVADHPRNNVLQLSLLSLAITTTAVVVVYNKVNRKTKQKK